MANGGSVAWLPWVGLVVVGGIAGGALGASGVLVPAPAEVVLAVGSLNDSVTAAGCPGGPAVAELQRGTRVLAVARSEDSLYLAIRQPGNLNRTVWVHGSSVEVDAAQPEFDTLPIDGCAEPTLAAAEPAPGVVPAPGGEPAPGGGTPVEPAPDGTPPSLSVGSFAPQPLAGGPGCSAGAMVAVTATDNVAVAAVSGTSNAAGGSVSLVSSSGSTFNFSFFAPYAGATPTIVTVTFTATDTSGNSASAPRTLVLNSNTCGVG